MFGRRTHPQVRKTGRSGGFTLVEVMVVMTMFGILATGMASMMSVLIQNNDFGRRLTEATTHAESKMEMFQNIDYEYLYPGYGSDSPSIKYHRSWLIEDNMPQAGMKQIAVTVGWYDRNEQWHSVSIYTAVCR